jgi:hypothetical protein
MSRIMVVMSAVRLNRLPLNEAQIGSLSEILFGSFHLLNRSRQRELFGTETERRFPGTRFNFCYRSDSALLFIGMEPERSQYVTREQTKRDRRQPARVSHVMCRSIACAPQN